MVASATPTLGRPTQADLDEIIDSLKVGVQTVVTKHRPQAIEPILHVLCLNSDRKVGTALIGLDGAFNSDEEKDKAMMSVAITLLTNGLIPLAVGLVSEAWTVNRGIDDPLSMPRPSECPDREEVAIVMVLSVDRKGLSSMAKIHRDRQDRIVRLDPFEDSTKSESPLLAKVFRYYASLLAEILA